MKQTETTDNKTEITEIKIAIIGAGPAGIAAAVTLSKLGHADALIVFDRENRVAMTSRHCDHQGFGVLEFKRPMRGSDYADALESRAKRYFVPIKLKHALTRIDEDLLTFSTPDGEVQYRAQRILFAMGAREKTRPNLLVSGGRSPNVITTGALQRFAYIQKRRPFSRAVIIGSEIISFSAIMIARHAGIEIVGIIEAEEKIQSFAALKYASRYLLKTPVYTSATLLSINTEEKEITGVTLSRNGVEETIACDGVIFSGHFIPESALLQKYFADFNLQNHSLDITQYFQTRDKRFFAAGNVLRGALTAFNCYFEGQKAGKAIHQSLQYDQDPNTVKLEVDPVIGWCFPTLLDLDSEPKVLTHIRFHRHTRGTLSILLNDKEIMVQKINAVPYLTIKVDWPNRPIREGDRVALIYREG